jgi:hypothetical protein
MFVKVDGRWKPRAIANWEREFGKIPKGLVVHHVDEKKMNDSVDNLALMTRTGHTRLHYRARGGIK